MKRKMPFEDPRPTKTHYYVPQSAFTFGSNPCSDQIIQAMIDAAGRNLIPKAIDHTKIRPPSAEAQRLLDALSPCLKNHLIRKPTRIPSRKDGNVVVRHVRNSGRIHKTYRYLVPHVPAQVVLPSQLRQNRSVRTCKRTVQERFAAIFERLEWRKHLISRPISCTPTKEAVELYYRAQQFAESTLKRRSTKRERAADREQLRMLFIETKLEGRQGSAKHDATGPSDTRKRQLPGMTKLETGTKKPFVNVANADRATHTQPGHEAKTPKPASCEDEPESGSQSPKCSSRCPGGLSDVQWGH